jgi:sugar phosphate permease
MVSYFFGGPLADRYSARALFTLALVATGFGGLVMAGIPSIRVLAVLYGFWGLTSILLLWAALIRATREWGGDTRLGSAYGFMEGGRGLVAAVVSSLGVFMLAVTLPPDGLTPTPIDQRSALRLVILLFTGATFAVAALAWFALPNGSAPGDTIGRQPRLTLLGVRRAAKIPAVWAQALIIVCAYCGYKSLDDLSLYAHVVAGLDEVRAAGIATATFWVRPLVAVAAGLLADRWRPSRMMLVCFALLFAGSGMLASGWLAGAAPGILLLTVAATATGVIALRGLYFAVMGEARVPLAVTGATVGLVSTLGYTPDIFMGPLMGWLLDSRPGPQGHFNFFTVVSGIALLGLLASLAFIQLAGSRRHDEPD